MKKLILAAALLAPLAGPALAQVSDVGGGSGNGPSSYAGQSYSSGPAREFTSRYLTGERQVRQAPAGVDRNAVPSSVTTGGN
jgi:opacity protein-like surface antigen